MAGMTGEMAGMTGENEGCKKGSAWRFLFDLLVAIIA